VEHEQKIVLRKSNYRL